MDKLLLLLVNAEKLVSIGAGISEAVVRARAIYADAKEQALRTGELTPDQSAELDAKAEAIFSSPAQEESGR